MRGFWTGIALGVLLGAGGMYIGLRKPWTTFLAQAPTAAPDAGAASGEGNSRKRKPKEKRTGRKAHSARVGDGPGGDEPMIEVSAADRQLTWRGDRVALAAKTLDMTSSDDGLPGRPLNQGEIDQGLAGATEGIADCIGQARGNANLTGAIALEMLVEGDGRVLRSRARAPRYLFEHGLLACLQKRVRGLRFESTGAQTIVTVPFDLY